LYGLKVCTTPCDTNKTATTKEIGINTYIVILVKST
jgi:hypothetical protein